MTIGICGAHPPAELVSAIDSLPELRLVTNSLTAWLRLTSSGSVHPNQPELAIVAGGVNGRGAVTGMLAIASVERFRFDLVLVCDVAFEETIGLTAPSLGEAAIARAFIRGASEVVAITVAPSGTEYGGVVVCGPEAVAAVLEQPGPARLTQSV
jgi:DeoR/GlpR family transcriptional regulator of sugar metabolism